MKKILVVLLLLSKITFGQLTNNESPEERLERIKLIQKEQREWNQKIKNARRIPLKIQWLQEKRNVISFSPYTYFLFQFPIQNLQNKQPRGVFIRYERLLIRNLSVEFPLFISLNTDYKYLGISCKFNPNSLKSTKYSLAATLLLGQNKINEYYYDDYGFAVKQNGVRRSYTFIINNSLNIYCSKRLYVNLMAGPGIDVDGRKKYKFPSIYTNNTTDFIKSSIYINTGLLLSYKF